MATKTTDPPAEPNAGPPLEEIIHEFTELQLKHVQALLNEMNVAQHSIVRLLAYFKDESKLPEAQWEFYPRPNKPPCMRALVPK